MNGIVPVPEDDDVTSGTPDRKCPHGHEKGDHHWFGCMGVSPFEPDYIYTVWAADGTTGGVMKVYQNTNRASAEDFAKRIVGSKSGAIMTRDEIILDMRR